MSQHLRSISTRDAQLYALILESIGIIEDACCTCPDTDTRNKLHSAPGRRRQDSACQGLSRAVRLDLRARRILNRREGLREEIAAPAPLVGENSIRGKGRGRSTC